MATTGIVNGTSLRLYKDSTAIGHATTCELQVSREQREILTKDSPGGGWREGKPGRKSFTMSTEALFSYDTANVAPSALFDALNNGTLMLFRFTTSSSGDTYWEGSAYCTSWAVNAVVEENVSYTATFEGNGALSSGTES